MSVDKKEKPALNGYTYSKQLIADIAETGMLTPMCETLDVLVEDPILKEALKLSPVGYAGTDKALN